MMTDTDWRHRAACRDTDPDLFFPISEIGPGARQADQATTVCAGCPVAAECLEFALAQADDEGIFGGTTPRQRRRMPRRAVRPSTTTAPGRPAVRAAPEPSWETIARRATAALRNRTTKRPQVEVSR